MSEPEPRPSWMPLWGEIDAACEIGKDRRVTVDRLLLATGLRAQIEALEEFRVEIKGEPWVEEALNGWLYHFRARLAELEGA